MKFQLPAFIILASLVIGCSKTAETGSATAVAVPADSQVIGTSEYSLTVPKGWLILDMAKETAESVTKKLKGTPYEGSTPVVSGFIGNKMIKTFGFIPELSGKSSANINVIVIDSPGSAKEILDGNETQMKAMDKGTAVLKDFVAIKDSRTMTSAIMGQKMIAMVAVQNSKQYVVTITTPPDSDPKKVQAVAKKVFATFVAK